MSSFSQFNRVKPFNYVDRNDISTEVSGDIPKIQKMYGVNTLYTNLVGDRNAKSSSVKTATSGDSMWLDIFEALTDYYTSTGELSKGVTRSELEADNLNYTGDGIGSNKLFWVGANKRNLYGVPKTGSCLELSCVVPPDYRKFWDIVSMSSVDQIARDEGAYELLSPCYIIYDGLSKSWEVLSPYLIDDFDFMAKNSINTALVIVFLVKHFSDSNKFAFYIKPIGVNKVYMDYFSRSEYQLEAVGFNNDRQFRVKPITVTEFIQDLHGERTGLTKSQWMIYDSDPKTDNVSNIVSKYIKFRLRRISDDNIGNLSVGTIKMIPRTSGAFIKCLVV